MIDVNQEMMTLLLADSTVTSIVGNRIYCPDMPKNTSKDQLIVFNVRGGSVVYSDLDELNPSFQFKCYGSDSIEAREVYGTLSEVFAQTYDNYAGENARMVYIKEEGFGQDIIDPDSGWPYVLAFFHALFLEN